MWAYLAHGQEYTWKLSNAEVKLAGDVPMIPVPFRLGAGTAFNTMDKTVKLFSRFRGYRNRQSS